MTDGEILSALRKGITSRLGELDFSWAQMMLFAKQSMTQTLKALEEEQGEHQSEWEYFAMLDGWRRLEETITTMRRIHTVADVLHGVLTSIERATAKEGKK